MGIDINKLLEEVKQYSTEELCQNFSWARTIISSQIDTIITSFDYHKLFTIITLAINEKETLIEICNNIFHSQDIDKRILLMDVLLDIGFPASEEFMIAPLYQTMENSHPISKKLVRNSIFNILEYRLDDPDIRILLQEHYEELFESAIHEKMQILSTLSSLFPDLQSEQLEKYGFLLSCFEQIPSENQKWADEILSNIIENNQEEEFLTELQTKFENQKIILRDSGSCSIVLGTKEWVLKISKERITWDCPRKSFLFAPTEFRKILDKNGTPIVGIDWQPYLPETNKKITKDLIYQYLVELKNQNLTLTDSSSLNYNSKNFRFLKDITPFMEQGVNLPDWFIENPLVSIDVDAIYVRGENKEADHKMDEAITKFKK